MQATDLYKALADETRLKSLLLIQAEQELCVCELMAALEESQPKVSRHLAQLRSLGLLQDRRQGQWVFYQLHPGLPAWVAQVLTVTAEAQTALLKKPLANLKRMGERPERASSCCPA